MLQGILRAWVWIVGRAEGTYEAWNSPASVDRV